MVAPEVFVGIAVFLGATIPLIWQLGRSVAKLEVRVNKIVEEKKGLINESYNQAAEEIVKSFQTVRKVSVEQQEKLEEIHYVKFRLNEGIPNGLQTIGNKIHNSVYYGILSVVFIIIFAYSLSLGEVNQQISFWFSLLTLLFGLLGLFKYLVDGILKVSVYREWESLVNKIERTDTTDKLYDLL